ncbi:DUF2971 domain-containing protein [Fibrisoma montanum]|uniref:DUF2971 domain-containing protein n=1 Tax=Fibrisoma montanum TaxID=2305895 RepID=A0A418M459_9BACT|nr:DUF2971 domain-containing protein [Fibrisoma montanum]RIV20499.1 DUF2971 domain-containing protein [Fibrisoma montanum]
MYNIPPIPILIPYYDRKVENFSGSFFADVPNTTLEKFDLPPKVIYHYTKLNTAELIIKGHKLNFSNPDRFNDPFDMMEDLIDFKAHGTQAKNWVNNKFKSRGRKERRKLTRRANEIGDQFADFRRQGFSSLKEQTGVCCFSKSPSKTLMWSHYADAHKGICIGFEIYPFQRRHLTTMMIGEVAYSERIIAKNYYEYEEEILRHWIFTKSHIWSYEEEVRAILFGTDGQCLFDFDKGCIKEIYYGCKVTDEEILSFQNLLDEHGYKHYSSYRMKIDKSTFDIKTEKLNQQNENGPKA